MPINRRRDPRDILRACISDWMFSGSLQQVISAVEELRRTHATEAIEDLRELFFLVDVPDPLDQPYRRCEHERLRDRLLAALREIGAPGLQRRAVSPTRMMFGSWRRNERSAAAKDPIDVLMPSHQDEQAPRGAQTQRLARIATDATSGAARAWALYHLARTDPIAVWPALMAAFERSPRRPLSDDEERARNPVHPTPDEALEEARRCARAVASALRFRDDRNVDSELWTVARDSAAKPQVRFWALASLSKRPLRETFDFRVPTSPPLPAELRNDIVQLYLPADPLRRSLARFKIHPDITFAWLIERMHLPVERRLSRLVCTPAVGALLEAGLLTRADLQHRRDTREALIEALTSALASAGYSVRPTGESYEFEPDIYLWLPHDPKCPDEFSSQVGVFLSGTGAYATATPYPEWSDEHLWARLEPVCDIARKVTDAHGWHWIDREVGWTVLPGFHFEGIPTHFGNSEDEVNTVVMDLLFPW